MTGPIVYGVKLAARAATRGNALLWWRRGRGWKYLARTAWLP